VPTFGEVGLEGGSGRLRGVVELDSGGLDPFEGLICGVLGDADWKAFPPLARRVLRLEGGELVEAAD
jgi:hypothetical protein